MRWRYFAIYFAGVALSTMIGANVRANEGSWLHKAQVDLFSAGGNTYYIDHTWAESLSAASGAVNDMLQNYPSMSWGACISTSSSSGCAGQRPSYTYQWSSSDYENESGFIYQYQNSDFGAGNYAYFGVCHQASNRALQDSTIPYTNSLNISGGGTSYNIFHYCGVTWPWGNWWSCTCKLGGGAYGGC
jgi:hypothetical protein